VTTFLSEMNLRASINDARRREPAYSEKNPDISRKDATQLV
jgi:hypothetical protein